MHPGGGGGVISQSKFALYQNTVSFVSVCVPTRLFFKFTQITVSHAESPKSLRKKNLTSG